MTEAVRRVRQMTMNARVIRVQGRHRHISLFPRADGPEEMSPFVTQIGLWLFYGDRLTFAHFSAFVSEKPFVANVKALGPEEAVAAVTAVGFFERTEIAYFERENRIVRVTEGRGLGVRSLAIILPSE